MLLYQQPSSIEWSDALGWLLFRCGYAKWLTDGISRQCSLEAPLREHWDALELLLRWAFAIGVTPPPMLHLRDGQPVSHAVLACQLGLVSLAAGMLAHQWPVTAAYRTADIFVAMCHVALASFGCARSRVDAEQVMQALLRQLPHARAMVVPAARRFLSPGSLDCLREFGYVLSSAGCRWQRVASFACRACQCASGRAGTAELGPMLKTVRHGLLRPDDIRSMDRYPLDELVGSAVASFDELCRLCSVPLPAVPRGCALCLPAAELPQDCDVAAAGELPQSLPQDSGVAAAAEEWDRFESWVRDTTRNVADVARFAQLIEPTSRRRTALMFLVQASPEDTAGLLLRMVDAGSCAHASDSDGVTALHIAAYHGYVGLMQVLLDYALVHPEPRDRQGATPMHYAEAFGHSAAVSLLERCGARRDARDKCNRTPAQWARAYKSIKPQ